MQDGVGPLALCHTRSFKIYKTNICRNGCLIIYSTFMCRRSPRCRAEVGQRPPRIGWWHAKRPPGTQKFTTPSLISSTMASATRRLLLQSRRCPSSIPSPSTAKFPSQWQRPLSTTTSRSAREDKRDGDGPRRVIKQVEVKNTESERAEQLEKLAEDLKALNPEVVAEAQRKGKHGVPFLPDYRLEKEEDYDIPTRLAPRNVKQGFWAEGEPGMGPDEDYYGDDITSHGHGELQRHRELREYARLIAWELPLLSRTLSTIQTTSTPHTNLPRTRAPLRTPLKSHPLPLPLHLLPGRIAPRSQQSRRRILPDRPRSPPHRPRKTNQTLRPALQPLHRPHQTLHRTIRHTNAKQALPRRNHPEFDCRSKRHNRHLRRRAV